MSGRFAVMNEPLKAIESGMFADEIVPVKVPQRKGEPIIVKDDESPRKDTSLEKLAKLKPVFNQEEQSQPGMHRELMTVLLLSF